MKPAWDSLMREYEGHPSVLIGDVDCTQHQDLCSDMGVGGYPTIKYYTADVDALLKTAGEDAKIVFLANPNNPTGAVYPKAILEGMIEIAREHKLIVFSDEIYDKILYDEAQHTCTASLANDLVFITFNGLSKTRAALLRTPKRLSHFCRFSFGCTNPEGV